MISMEFLSLDWMTHSTYGPDLSGLKNGSVYRGQLMFHSHKLTWQLGGMTVRKCTVLSSPWSERHCSNLACNTALVPLIGRPRSASSFFNSATFDITKKAYRYVQLGLMYLNVWTFIFKCQIKQLEILAPSLKSTAGAQTSLRKRLCTVYGRFATKSFRFKSIRCKYKSIRCTC